MVKNDVSVTDFEFLILIISNWNPNWELLIFNMDKLKLTGQNMRRIFKSRLGRICTGHELYTLCKTA